MGKNVIRISGFLQTLTGRDYITVAESIRQETIKLGSEGYNCHKLNLEESKSFFICLVLDAFGRDERSDILLCAWALLKGYEYGKNLTQRRSYYLEQREKYIPEAIKKQPFNSLKKSQQISKANALLGKENKLCSEIETYFNMIADKIKYINNARKKFVEAEKSRNSEYVVEYPIPSYIASSQHKENPEDNVKIAETFGLPFTNNWFSGRVEEIKTIENNFKKGVYIQILNGMGGMGKTQTAIKFVYDHISEYSLIHWINGCSIESIVLDYKSFLNTKCILPSDTSTNSICHTYIDYMNNHSNWLIIYDNYDCYSNEEYNEFKKLCLPKNFSTGNILITSRNNRKIGDSKIVDINSLLEEDSIQFLLKRTETDNRIMAKKLAKRLGYFPLAMEIAGAYIYATPSCNMEQYLSYLNESSSILDKMVDVTDYNNTIKEVILLTLERIKKDNSFSDYGEYIETIIYLSAYGDSNEIDFSIYALLASNKNYPHGSIGEIMYKKITRHENWKRVLKLSRYLCNQQECGDIARTVVKYGLMTYSAEHLEMHALQQEIIRDQIITDSFWCDVSELVQQEYFRKYKEHIRDRIIEHFKDDIEVAFLEPDEKCASILVNYIQLIKNEVEAYSQLFAEFSSALSREKCFIRFLVLYEELSRYYFTIDNDDLARKYLGLFLFYNSHVLECFGNMKRLYGAGMIIQIAINSISLIIDRFGNNYVCEIDNDTIISQAQINDGEYCLLASLYYNLYGCLTKLALNGELVWMDDSKENLVKFQKVLKLFQKYTEKYWHNDISDLIEKYLIRFVEFVKDS